MDPAGCADELDAREFRIQRYVSAIFGFFDVWKIVSLLRRFRCEIRCAALREARATDVQPTSVQSTFLA